MTRLRLHPLPDKPALPPGELAGAYDAVATSCLGATEEVQGAPPDMPAPRDFVDRALWKRLDTMLVQMWSEGRRAIRILDAGCGSGLWLFRLATRAGHLGFAAIDVHGIDISPAMIAVARSRAAGIEDARIGIRFDVGDIARAIDEEDEQSFDIVLCLNGVLNHLAGDDRARAAAAMERVCDGEIFVTAYAAGSHPPVHLAAAQAVRHFLQNNGADRLEIDLADGRHVDLPSHLFRAAELMRLFSGQMRQVELVGLDLFHARFGDDPQWNPADIDHRARDEELDRLEQLCEAMPALIDSASQILFHGRIGG